MDVTSLDGILCSDCIGRSTFVKLMAEARLGYDCECKKADFGLEQELMIVHELDNGGRLG